MPKAKSTIPYYGAKSSMANIILPMIPKDIDSYVEPFAGGSSIFFLRNAATYEVLNDKSDTVVNFYIQVKQNYNKLKKMIEATPFSRRVHKQTNLVLKYPVLHDKLTLAWAFYVNLVVSFSNVLGGGFSTDKHGKKLKSFVNKKSLFLNGSIPKRLDKTVIESLDANDCIKKYDHKNAYFFCDPPYVTDNPDLNIDRGHYKDYELEDFRTLLETLSHIKGRFMLTTYKSQLLEDFIKQNGWHTKNYERPISASLNKGTKRKIKTEVITTNYPI